MTVGFTVGLEVVTFDSPPCHFLLRAVRTMCMQCFVSLCYLLGLDALVRWPRESAVVEEAKKRILSGLVFAPVQKVELCAWLDVPTGRGACMNDVLMFKV